MSCQRVIPAFWRRPVTANVKTLRLTGSYSCLFVILCISLRRDGCESPEQTVRIVIDACGEEKSRSRRRSCRRARFVGASIVEFESPQPVDCNGCVVRIEQVPQELSAHDVECGDRSSEPVADQ